MTGMKIHYTKMGCLGFVEQSRLSKQLGCKVDEEITGQNAYHSAHEFQTPYLQVSRTRGFQKCIKWEKMGDKSPWKTVDEELWCFYDLKYHSESEA